MPYHMGPSYKTKPWRAAARRLGNFYHLGYFATYEEAAEAEAAHAEWDPPTRNQPHQPREYHMSKIQSTTEETEMKADETVWKMVNEDERYGIAYRVTAGALEVGYRYSNEPDIAEIEHLSIPGPFESIRDLSRRNAAAGGHYFDKDTTDFFGAMYHDLIGGRILIDSAQPPQGPREYRAVVFSDNGKSGSRLGEFYSLDGALVFAHGLISGVSA
jgi:hypothetical protein